MGSSTVIAPKIMDFMQAMPEVSSHKSSTDSGAFARALEKDMKIEEPRSDIQGEKPKQPVENNQTVQQANNAEASNNAAVQQANNAEASNNAAVQQANNTEASNNAAVQQANNAEANNNAAVQQANNTEASNNAAAHVVGLVEADSLTISQMTTSLDTDYKVVVQQNEVTKNKDPAVSYEPQINIAYDVSENLTLNMEGLPLVMSAEKEDVYEPEVLVGLTDQVLPSAPVLHILSTELNADDLKMYMAPPKDTGPIAPQVFPVIKEVSQEQVVLKPVQVTFTPGAQAESKVEMAPQFIEVVQAVPLKKESEEMPEAAMLKGDDKNIKPEVTLTKEAVSGVKQIESSPLQNKVKAPSADMGELKPVSVVLDKDIAPENHKFQVNENTQPILEVKDALPVKVTPMTQAQIMARAPQIVQDVAVHMKQAVDLGMDKITIQVNPPALGKIEVQLHFSQDGRVNAILMADKTETYDLLRQNSQMLKDSLAEAGINADTTDLNFSLRGEGDDRNNQKSPKGAKGSDHLGLETIETVNYRKSPVINLTKQVDIHA